MWLIRNRKYIYTLVQTKVFVFVVLSWLPKNGKKYFEKTQQNRRQLKEQSIIINTTNYWNKSKKKQS